MSRYVGRFAPSPTGPLHAGSLVAALASWLDARAHGGKWLVRIEDVDLPRCVHGMGTHILQQLAALGMHSDAPVAYQSTRTALYDAALHQLQAQGLVYRCYCSRQQITLRTNALIYPGTCLSALPLAKPHSYRLRTVNHTTHWTDRRLGVQAQNVFREVGDFIVRRSDGLFAYQLAVVVDDLAQGVTHIVRGEDLANNTERQLILKDALQATLGKDLIKANCQYLHVPLVRAADGQKLSKQNGAMALPLDSAKSALHALQTAAMYLGLSAANPAHLAPDALAAWVQQWAALYNRRHER